MGTAASVESWELSPKHAAVFERLQKECGELPDDRMDDHANIRIGLIKRYVLLEHYRKFAK